MVTISLVLQDVLEVAPGAEGSGAAREAEGFRPAEVEGGTDATIRVKVAGK